MAFTRSEKTETLSDGTEVRKYTCDDCGGEFWVDCDASDYPNNCPYCASAAKNDSES